GLRRSTYRPEGEDRIKVGFDCPVGVFRTSSGPRKPETWAAMYRSATPTSRRAAAFSAEEFCMNALRGTFNGAGLPEAHGEHPVFVPLDLVVRVLAQLAPGHLTTMHRVGAVGEAERADMRPHMREGDVLADAPGALHLHRFVDDLQRRVRGDHL